MTVRVLIPPVLRNVTGGRRALESDGETLQEVLVNLTREHPALALHLFDERGDVRRHVLCIHDSAAVRPPEFTARRMRDGDEIIITNALAGG